MVCLSCLAPLAAAGAMSQSAMTKNKVILWITLILSILSVIYSIIKLVQISKLKS